MDFKMEIRACIKFCFKLGFTATETFEKIKKVHGEEAMGRTQVFHWFALFKDGRESLEDEPRTGRPKEGRSPDNIREVADVIKKDRRLSKQMISDMTGIPQTTVYRILTEDLHLRKLCARFVPHKLTDDQQVARVEHCLDMKQSADTDPTFLYDIVNGDETWVFQYDPSSKRQSSEWLGPGDKKPTKSRLQKSRVKTMLIVFFDSRSIIHKEFVPPGKTVTGEFYVGVMRRLLDRITRVRPQYREQGSWRLLHDNAPAHNSRVVKEFLAKRSVVILQHPPYSPDLAPADFWLFPKLKLNLKGRQFESVDEIQRTVTGALNALEPKAFSDCYDSFYKRFQRCINEEGAYFE